MTSPIAGEFSMRNEIEFRLEWADADPAGIAFYPNFFKYFDLGTWHLLFNAGFTFDVLRNELGLIGCPIVEARSKFHHPARFWDAVRLRSEVRSSSRKTFEVGHEIWIADRLCVEGTEIRVCARHAPERPQQIEAVAIPDAMQRKFRGG
jgi:4-hydroxybenzoyl-CoA thioesterase